MTHGLHCGALSSVFLGAPLALEAQKLLIWSARLLSAPLALDLGPQIAPRALWCPKESHWLRVAPTCASY